MNAFCTLEELETLTGKTYTATEEERIEALLPMVSNALRVEAIRYGKNLDEMISADTSGAYGDLVELVTVDIVARVMRQTYDGDPMSQESQSALGYTWSGTYAIPGGGIAAAIMRNDLKRLGIRRQKYGVMDFTYPAPETPELIDEFYLVGADE